jgi:pimeloyl-ACP methyl ester carboxylesterase
VLVHGAVIADAFSPLTAVSAVTDACHVLRYHRRGYGASAPTPPPASVKQHADDCRALMRRCGIERAHLVGHSFGGAVALQLALDSPAMVHSLALLEPAILSVPSVQMFADELKPIMARYQAGDKAAAIDAFLRLVGGADYRAFVDATIPDAIDAAIRDADSVFVLDLPAITEWRFTREDARQITQPVLAVVGATSASLFTEIHDLVLEWMPQAKPFRLSGASHLLQMANPNGLTDAGHVRPRPPSRDGAAAGG